MKLYRTRQGVLAEYENRFYALDVPSWDELLSRENLLEHLEQMVHKTQSLTAVAPQSVLPPIGAQEVWAAGVTYYRSRNARMEESKIAGGGDFYDRVYLAPRPELFFKSSAHRVVGYGGKVAIRSDASWSVPEPELTLMISPKGKII